MATAPVVSSYLSFDQVTRTMSVAQRELFDYPIGFAVALFFLLSARRPFRRRIPVPRLV